MVQTIIKAQQMPYALISGFTLINADPEAVQNALYSIRSRFPKSILHCSKSMHEMLTQEQCFDVPSFPRIKTVQSAQADLLLLIYLDAPQSTERIELKRIINGVFQLVDQRLCYSSSKDPANNPFYSPKHDVAFETENGGTYSFYLRFSADPISWQYLEPQEQAAIVNEREERWSDLVNFRLLTFNYFDNQNGFVVIGYAQNLVRFEEFIRRIMGFADEFSDRFITEYSILQAQGCFYCLSEAFFDKAPHGITEQKFPVAKRAKWPKRDDEEEPEEEQEQEEKSKDEEKQAKEEGEEEAMEENEEKQHTEPSNKESSNPAENPDGELPVEKDEEGNQPQENPEVEEDNQPADENGSANEAGEKSEDEQ